MPKNEMNITPERLQYSDIEVGDRVMSGDREMKITYKSPPGERWVIRGTVIIPDGYGERTLPLCGITRVQTLKDTK